MWNFTIICEEHKMSMEPVEVKVTREVKVVVLGDPRVGKSTIVSRFCQGKIAQDNI